MGLVTVNSAETVIGCAITVHRALGPGLFESVYEPCLVHELTKAGLKFARQVLLPIQYDGLVFARAFRADLIVEGELLVEIKSIERVLSVHHAQVLTYLRLSGLKKALLINFNAEALRAGIKSFVM